jgi:hypothetical protein
MFTAERVDDTVTRMPAYGSQLVGEGRIRELVPGSATYGVQRASS